jgi:hypothetical protein
MGSGGWGPPTAKSRTPQRARHPRRPLENRPRRRKSASVRGYPTTTAIAAPANTAARHTDHQRSPQPPASTVSTASFESDRIRNDQITEGFERMIDAER